MQLIFLGTSSGMPTKQRNVSALAIYAGSRRWYLVDCGEGTQQQLLQTTLSLSRLHAIFITHVHGDHCYGLPGLLSSATLQGRTEPLHLIAPQSLQAWLEATLALSQARLSYEVHFQAVETPNADISLPDFSVTTIELSHRVPTYAYRFTSHQSIPRIKLDQAKLIAAGIPAGAMWGQLQRGETVTLSTGELLKADDYSIPTSASEPQAIIIGGDNDQPERLAPFLQQVQLVVHEATYTQAIANKIGPMPQHSSARQIASFAQYYAIPNLILTHFSARYSDDNQPIADEARQFYHGNLYLADDFARYQLHEDGHVELMR